MVRLETVARSSLDFTAALREAAYIVDPSLELIAEFISGSPGSLSINSILKAAGVADRFTKLAVKAVALGAITWLTNQTCSWAWQQVLVHFNPLFNSERLSETDKEDIAKKIAQILQNDAPNAHIRSMFQALNDDASVTGAGVGRSLGSRPETLVPRSEFRARATKPAVLSEVRPDRIITERETVILISPVLLDDTTRKWRFKGKRGDFSAEIKDRSFLDGLLQGRILIKMVSGITLDVDLQTKWTYSEDNWAATESSVLKVQGAWLPNAGDSARFAARASLTMTCTEAMLCNRQEQKARQVRRNLCRLPTLYYQDKTIRLGI